MATCEEISRFILEEASPGICERELVSKLRRFGFFARNRDVKERIVAEAAFGRLQIAEGNVCLTEVGRSWLEGHR